MRSFNNARSLDGLPPVKAMKFTTMRANVIPLAADTAEYNSDVALCVEELLMLDESSEETA